MSTVIETDRLLTLHKEFKEEIQMFSKDMSIAGFDDELWSAMQNEKQRQEDHIELIASENNVSPRVLQAQGSVLTNKYALLRRM